MLKNHAFSDRLRFSKLSPKALQLVASLILAASIAVPSHSQPIRPLAAMNQMQGEWETQSPISIGNVVLNGFKLFSDGSMIAKVTVNGVSSEAKFSYNLTTPYFVLTSKEAIGSLSAGRGYKFHMRRHYDGGLEFEDHDNSTVTQGADGRPVWKFNAAVYSKVDPSSKPNPSKQASSAIDELASIENQLQRKNLYGGNSVTSKQALQSAKSKASFETNNCPKNSVPRKSEDVREYLMKQESLQSTIAMNIEKYTNKTITKSEAIDNFNALITQSNEITTWGWGKVTNGTCGPIEITNLIGKSVGTTKNLFNDFRQMIERN